MITREDRLVRLTDKTLEENPQYQGHVGRVVYRGDNCVSVYWPGRHCSSVWHMRDLEPAEEGTR